MIIDTNGHNNMGPFLSGAQAPSHKNAIFKAPADISSQPFSQDESRETPITATISFYSYSHEEDDDIIFHEDIEVCECLCSETKPYKQVEDDELEFKIERMITHRHELLPYRLSSDHTNITLSQAEEFQRRSILLAMETDDEEEREEEERLVCTDCEGVASLTKCEPCRNYEGQYNFKTYDTFQPLKNAIDEVVAAFSSRVMYDKTTDTDGATVQREICMT